MNPSISESTKQLKQLVINQKSAHLSPPIPHPQLEHLYETIRAYDEHLSYLLFHAFRGEGNYSLFPGMDDLHKAAAQVVQTDEPHFQRVAGVYLRYLDQLFEIDTLVKQILAPNESKES